MASVWTSVSNIVTHYGQYVLRSCMAISKRLEKQPRQARSLGEDGDCVVIDKSLRATQSVSHAEVVILVGASHLNFLLDRHDVLMFSIDQYCASRQAVIECKLNRSRDDGFMQTAQVER